MDKKYLLLTERKRYDVMEYMPNKQQIEFLASFFQNLADSTRLKIIICLCMNDMCVNDLSCILGINQTTISHQLQTLRAEGIIEYRRLGKIIIYSLKLAEVNDIMLAAVNAAQ